MSVYGVSQAEYDALAELAEARKERDNAHDAMKIIAKIVGEVEAERDALKKELADWQRMRNESMDLAHKLSDALKATQAELAEASKERHGRPAGEQRAIEYSIKLQRLIENLKYETDTPYPELHHHKMIVTAKAELTACREASEAMRAALNTVRTILQSDSIEYDDLRNIDQIIESSLALKPSDANPITSQAYSTATGSGGGNGGPLPDAKDRESESDA